jgi:hypothetical protein
MSATQEQVGIEEMTSADLAALEPGGTAQVKVTPGMAARLWLKTSLRLTRAQKELHDAIFTHDGSEASLERYAAARAELDSAEAWALRIAKAFPRRR